MNKMNKSINQYITKKNQKNGNLRTDQYFRKTRRYATHNKARNECCANDFIIKSI